MPAVNPNRIVDSIIDAAHQSGETAVFTSATAHGNPRKFYITYQGQRHSLWVYIWTITHGGRATLPDEYRIQMTSVTSPLPLNPDGLTVLMGYYPDQDMFAGFDLHQHRTFTTGSPSVQINIQAINDALQNGLSFAIKDNDEIAIGVRPDHLAYYCANAESLHTQGSNSGITRLLVNATKREDVDISTLSVERKKIIQTVSKLSRDSNFKKTVLNAYDNRCAVTRAQLRLVDAAHILPVASQDSSDHVSNGLSLSPTIHRAYDNCLIYLDDQYNIQLNSQKVDQLTSCNLIAGLTDLVALVNRRIHLPGDENQWPNKDYIRLANKYRRIPGF